MDAREYLLQVKYMDRRIKNKLEEIEYWKDQAENPALAPFEAEKVQSTRNISKTADLICKYVDLQQELQQNIEELAAMRKQTIATLEQLPLNEYDVLYKLYIQYERYYNMQAVADALEKSYSWVTMMHDRALKSLQKLIDERR